VEIEALGLVLVSRRRARGYRGAAMPRSWSELLGEQGAQQESDEERHQLYGAHLLYTRTAIEPSLAGTDIMNLASDAGKTIVGLTRKNRLMLAVPGLRIQPGDEIVQAELE